jgi:conjugal transfer mating pair stabilization protein TraG
LGKTYNDNAPSSSTKPKLTPGQGAIIEKGHEEAWDNSIKAREDMLNVKQTGGLFNDERFNKITTDTEQQQTIANEQITKPATPLVDLSIKTEVETETTRPEPPNYVQTGQSYPSVPAYTKKPE